MASEQTSRRVFTGLILLSILLLALVIQPLAKAFFLAAILAGALYGLHSRLTRRLRGRKNISAGLICTAVILALLVPIGGFTAFVVAEVSSGAQFVSRTVQQEGVEGLVQKLPAPLRKGVEGLLKRLPVEEANLDERLQQQVSSQSATAARAVTGAVAATGSIAFQAVMMLIAFFFFLTDGKELVEWLESVSPLRPGETLEIMREFRSVSGAVLLSSLATAGVQALAALIGFLIARVPAPLFFAGITFFLALIPAVGAAVVVLVAAALMYFSGHPWAALFLAIWGTVVVGLVDNIVKPLLAKRGMHQHGAIVFFSLLGGLAAFGTVGLLLGPLIVAFFLALVRIHERDYGRNHPGPDSPSTPGPQVSREPDGQGLVSKGTSPSPSPAPERH
ncbi:AI-2E family transporter [Myxococcus landrumensis]|uniref:AI-2E family transporter n=1 Tax=Myxococcus landrumensis TaxID=2813577 RepID=A0ABX7NG95_9BACT|nr:AI-2E family transporter [Myxococcus landrumus]QSQ17780.1 AI-2E family transporter [Myxococcus landrumus]